MSKAFTATLTFVPVDTRPLATGRYLVVHRGHAKIYWFLSPTDRNWMPGTKMGWRPEGERLPEEWNATHCALLPDIPEGCE